MKFLLVLSLGVSIKRTDVYSISVSRDSFISEDIWASSKSLMDQLRISLAISAFLHLRVYFNSS